MAGDRLAHDVSPVSAVSLRANDEAAMVGNRTRRDHGHGSMDCRFARFFIFVNSFGSYDKTYGSIGAVIALLVWMYASGLVILIGGEINARWRELCCEKQAALLTKGAGQMRKTLITTEIQKDIHPELNWLDLVTIARVELTSEDPAHPVESALISSGGSGWRALEPGRQTIRLLFDEPLEIKRIHLMFHEDEQQRTQEFVLRWSPDNGRSYREIVRQQYNFYAFRNYRGDRRVYRRPRRGDGAGTDHSS